MLQASSVKTGGMAPMISIIHRSNRARLPAEVIPDLAQHLGPRNRGPYAGFLQGHVIKEFQVRLIHAPLAHGGAQLSDFIWLHDFL